jgi:hypothetical protein
VLEIFYEFRAAKKESFVKWYSLMVYIRNLKRRHGGGSSNGFYKEDLEEIGRRVKEINGGKLNGKSQ